MRAIIILSFLLLILVAPSCISSGNGQNVAENDPTKDLFKQYCALCHGMDGKLKLNGAKDFSESVLTFEERVQIITEGKNTMTPFKGILTAEQIEVLAEYTMKFKE